MCPAHSHGALPSLSIFTCTAHNRLNLRSKQGSLRIFSFLLIGKIFFTFGQIKEVFLFIVCVLHTARARLKRYGSSRDILVLHPSHGLEPSPDVTIPIANRFLKNVLQGAFPGFSSTSLAKKLVDLGVFPGQETHNPLTFSDKLELLCTTVFPAKRPAIHRKREFFSFENFPPPSNQAEYVAWCGGSSSNVNFAKKKKKSPDCAKKSASQTGNGWTTCLNAGRGLRVRVLCKTNCKEKGNESKGGANCEEDGVEWIWGQLEGEGLFFFVFWWSRGVYHVTGPCFLHQRTSRGWQVPDNKHQTINNVSSSERVALLEV